MIPDPDTPIPATRTTVLIAVTMIVGLLLGCATADEPSIVPATSGTIPDGFGRERFATPAESDTGGGALPILPAGLALFHTLISKPAARPLSSLHRLASYVTSTTFDTLKLHKIFGCRRFRNQQHLAHSSANAKLISTGKLPVNLGSFVTIINPPAGKTSHCCHKYLDKVYMDIVFGDCMSLGGF